MAGVWRVLLWFSFGVGIRVGDSNEKTAIGQSITLLGLVLGGTVALGAALRETGSTQTDYVWLYFFAAWLPLGAMSSILRASDRGARETLRCISKGEGRKMRHFYDHVTVNLTRWSLASCLVLVITGTIFAFYGRFPGQEPPRQKILSVSKVVDHYPDPEVHGHNAAVKAQVVIDKKEFPEGIPNRLPLTIMLTGELKDGWEIKRVDASEVEAGEPGTGYQGAYYVETEVPYIKGAFLIDLKRNGTYLVEIYLHAKSQEAERDEAKDLIMEEHRMTVLPQPL